MVEEETGVPAVTELTLTREVDEGVIYRVVWRGLYGWAWSGR